MTRVFHVGVSAIVAAVSVMLGASRALAQPLNGLIGRWAFDEGSGTVVADSSPNHNDGTLINGASAWAAGVNGGGLFFDGSSLTEVRIPVSASLNSITAATFAAWVNSAEPNRDSPIIAKEGSNLRSYWFGVIGGQFGMLLSPDGVNWPTMEPSRRIGSVPTDHWIHLAATWDGSTMRMYENGVFVGSYPYAQPVATTAAYVSIGLNSQWPEHTQFHGILDDVFMYNRALSAAEIVSVMGTTTCTDTFTDNFNPPSGGWNNMFGDWTAVNGQYYPRHPNNRPYACSALPWDLQDFEVNVDVNNLTDGGIWLRSDGTNQNGMLLITGGWGYGQGNHSPPAGTLLYFHRVVNGVEGPAYAVTASLFTPGTDHHIRVVVVGNIYAVFVDGADTPATYLVDGTFTHGRVGLYGDQANTTTASGYGPPQTFSNFSLVSTSGAGPWFALQPANQVTCLDTSADFNVLPAGTGPFSYHWQLETSPGNWINANNGALPYNGGTIIAGGVTTDHLALSLNVLPGAPAVRFRCVVTGACNTITSNPATLSFVATCCPADLDDGSNTGTKDGAITIDDLLYFLAQYEAGSLPADLDDGSGTGAHDGAVTIDDLLFFLLHYEGGC